MIQLQQLIILSKQEMDLEQISLVHHLLLQQEDRQDQLLAGI
jgi:hypothetical protein